MPPPPCRADHRRKRLEKLILAACLGVLLAQGQHGQQMGVVDSLQRKHDHTHGHEQECHRVAVLTKDGECRDGDADRKRAIRKQKKHSHLDLKRDPAAFTRNSEVPLVSGSINMKGTVSPANCTNNSIPMIRPTLFADLIISSFEIEFKGIPGYLNGPGLLLPSLNVHAHHEEPQGQRSFPEDAGDENVGGQIVCERR